MEPLKIKITELLIAGEKVPPAAIQFVPGLNIVVGASDTGKTFVFEALDFMMGAKDGLRRIPESKGYDRVFLSFEPTDRPSFTVRRGFDGGQYELSEFSDGRDQPPTVVKTLAAQHSADPDASLSSYLLRTIGLIGREVRKNDKGEKTALTFRDVAHLTLINETEIIEQISPILTGQYLSKTREQNVFAFFLTNQDDSQIIAQESRKDRNARLAIEESTIESILEEKQAELATLTNDPDKIGEQTERLEESIRQATEAVIHTQEEIVGHERRRAVVVKERGQLVSRSLFLGEQLKRLRLLDQYYISDRERLQAVVEASQVYHDLPEGSCPLCERPFVSTGEDGSPDKQFESSCLKEIQKIVLLQADLKEAINDFENEAGQVKSSITDRDGELHTTDTQLQHVLTPVIRVAQLDLQILIQKKASVAQSEVLKANTRSLQDRLDRIKQARGEKVPRSSFEPRASTSVAFEFCKVVEDILRAWRFPNLGTVSFDTEKGDLVIGDQDRANKGKGYRAVTYAAFTIGLMKYCRLKNIPHPGFVVIDTPMNPFKGPDAANAKEKVANDVKAAFYEYLANDTSGDQVIILENEEPPEAIRDRVNYFHFSGNPEIKRSGFFPPKDDTQPVTT